MLKQLRRKFIILNMAMVTAVVVAVLAAIGIANYQQTMSSVYSSLDESLRQAAQLSTGEVGPHGRAGWGEDPKGGSFFGPTPQLGNQRKQFVPVAVYQDQEGYGYALVSEVTTAHLDEELLEKAIDRTNTGFEGRGSLPDLGLIYAKRFMGGYSYIAFTDAANASGWQSLVLVLVGIGALALLVFFAISLFFSRWALKPVEEAWEQQRQFVADASHELKTPITVILANMSIMQKHPQDTITDQAKWVESTQREAQGMQDLVTDLLDLARLESDKAPVVEETIDLSEMAEGRLLQFDSVAFESNVLTDYEVEPGISVRGNRSQLERLVTILLDNACKYADPGSTINISLSKGLAGKPAQPYAIRGDMPKGVCALLSVTNHGNVVSAEDLPHLFDRFYRSDQARVRTEGSYGLGLAIAAETALGHKGAITVQSSLEAGTTFTVMLPLE